MCNMISVFQILTAFLLLLKVILSNLRFLFLNVKREVSILASLSLLLWTIRLALLVLGDLVWTIFLLIFIWEIKSLSNASLQKSA